MLTNIHLPAAIYIFLHIHGVLMRDLVTLTCH